MLLFLSLLILVASSVSGSDSDKSALLQFKASLSDPYGALSNWVPTGSSHCSWDGVTCDSNSRVSALNITGGGRGEGGNSCARIAQFPLYGFGIRRNCYYGSDNVVKLAGSISPEVAKLTELRVLSLPFNELSGEIPVEVWGMEKLEVLDLEGNDISGSLPSRFGGLKGLRVLNLGFNGISGEIPDSLSGFTSLQVLNLAGNRVNGGAVPKEIGFSCGKLEYLELAGNFLIGGIPRSLGNCSGLRSLVLYSNLLQEAIPVELGRLNELQVLDVSRNSLSGSIPLELKYCSNLSVLVLSNLFDPVPSSEGDSYLGLSSSSDEFNFFEGVIPAEIATLPKLKIIWAPRVLAPGNLPSDWGSCDNLEMVNFGQNLFNGEISEGFIHCRKLHFLDLSLNRLTGELSEKPLAPCMTVFDVSGNVGVPFIGDVGGLTVYHNFGGNNFTGDLQSMPIGLDRLGEQTGYAFLAVENKLTGPFPGDLLEKCNGLDSMIVNVSNNKIIGQIPADIESNPKQPGQIRDLKYLSLAGNNLSGSIPASLGQLHSLEVLDLSSNLLSGEIPKDLVNLSNLTVLLLNNNKLSGQIPPGLANVTTLSAFNASFNNLSGPLPLKDNLMKCSSVLGNPFLRSCRMFSLTVPSTDPQGRDLLNSAATPPSSPPQRSGNSSAFNSIEIASITSASAILSVLIALVILYVYTRKWNPRSRIGGSARKEVTIFTDIGVRLTFEDVVRATGSFNASNCIGSGGFGATYKAEISLGVLVAIKRLAIGRFQGVQQFDAEIKTLGRLRHPNLVTLIGYHASETEMFLIYNYLPDGQAIGYYSRAEGLTASICFRG
ncbi:hypothetical protein C3L33_18747, partial [Rhododendron williamsianum]